MDKYEIIDVHVHLVRTAAQAKVAFPEARGREPRGTPDDVIPCMDRMGVSKAVFLNVFPTNEMIESAVAKLPTDLSWKQRQEAEEKIRRETIDRIRRHNDWACGVEKQYPRLIPFIGIQKLLGVDGMAEEVERGVSHGARGVKLHPGMFSCFPNDRDLWPFYAKCQELGVPIIADSAPFRGAPQGTEFGEPKHFAEVLQDFPRLVLILAHLGRAFWDERLELSQYYPNLYFDTSQGFVASDCGSVCGGLVEAEAVTIMRKIGIERIMFGSDSPAFNYIEQIKQILRLVLSDEEKGMVLAENAKRILKI